MTEKAHADKNNSTVLGKRIVRCAGSTAVCGIPSREVGGAYQIQAVDWELRDWPLQYAGVVDRAITMDLSIGRISIPQIVEIDNTSAQALLQDVTVSKRVSSYTLREPVLQLEKEIEMLLRAGNPSFNDGLGVRLADWHREDRGLVIDVQPVAFTDVLKSNMQMDRVLSNGETLRTVLHENGRLEPLDESVLGNPIGVDILLFTKRGDMVVQKRSERMAIRPGALAPSVSGGFDWEDVAPDDVRTLADVPIWREMIEELGVAQGVLRDLHFLGVARELARGGQPEAFFSGSLDVTTEDLTTQWAAARDSWEASQLRFYALGELAVRRLRTRDEYEELARCMSSLLEEILEESSVTLLANIALWLAWKRNEYEDA